MKNMLGEDVDVMPLRFEWTSPKEGYSYSVHMWIYRGKLLFGNVSPNGWTGYRRTIQHELYVPQLQNIGDPDLSFTELNQIMDEYWSHVTPEQVKEFVDNQIRAEKEREAARA